MHELYFTNLTPGGRGSPVIDRELLDDVARYGEAATGWVVVGMDTRTGEVFPFMMENHGSGYVAQVEPLLVLDVYEHAYWGALSKEAYIEAFFRNVNWKVIHDRLRAVAVME